MYSSKLHRDGLAEMTKAVKTAGPLNSREMILGMELARPFLPDREKRKLDAAFAVFRFLEQNFPSDIRPRDLPPGIGLVAITAAAMAMEASQSLLIDGREDTKP
jgi:hypothetical protein